MAYIYEIAKALPRYSYEQAALGQFYARATDDELSKRKARIIAAKSGVNRRYSVLADYGQKHPEDYSFFPKIWNLEPSPSLTARMQIYRKEALALSLQAVAALSYFEEQKQRISHVLTVSCTGLYAPGLDIELCRELGLGQNTQRLGVYFMGCNAALMALRQAEAICKAQEDALVLLVCTELCTLHFQKDYSDDYILANLLFGDGSAAVLLGGKKRADGPNFALRSCSSHFIPSSEQEMAWTLSERGFLMRLSSYVSGIIEEHIGALLEQEGIDKEQVGHWAVHPGGKRILDYVQRGLDLDASALEASRQVLRDYGNMSSPTILFVLQKLFEQIAQGEKKPGSILALAFGPGLSIELTQIDYVLP